MRPPGPLPATWRISTPSSRASRRTDGAAGAAGPCGSASLCGAAAGAFLAARLMSTTSPRFFVSGAGSGLSQARPRVPLRDLASALSSFFGSCFASCLGAPSFPPGPPSRAVVEREHDLPDLHTLALLDLDFLDRAAHVRRHLDRRLVGFELEDRLVFLDRIPRRHQQTYDVAAGDVLAQFWKCEIGGHVLAISSQLSALSGAAFSIPPSTFIQHSAFSIQHYTVAGLGLSVLMPKSLIAWATTERSICPSCASSASVATATNRASTSKKFRRSVRSSLRPKPSVPS